MTSEEGSGSACLETRPGVLLVGAPGVGKRTLLSRLVAADIPDTHDLSSGVLCQGWTIETKYYSADVSVWTGDLNEGFSFESLPNADRLAAIVMVFDMSDESSFLNLQSWVANADISRFEILLCIGNKADLVPGHQAHAEYRRTMQKLGESISDPHPEYLDFGIEETEGFSLLSEEEPSIEIRSSSSQWCIENNIEYIEACASDADFDKCLSVDGDIQGVQRLLGALSAHMWPGMVLKSGNRITTPSLVEKQETTDDESNYDFAYEELSNGSDEQWEYFGESSTMSTVGIVSEDNQDRVHLVSDADVGASASSSLWNDISDTFVEEEPLTRSNTVEESDQEHNGNTTTDQMQKTDVEVPEDIQVSYPDLTGIHEGEHYGFDDIERLMSEMGNMRDNLRLMPDFQRREMAAQLAMKMAAMFGDNSDEEDA